MQMRFSVIEEPNWSTRLAIATYELLVILWHIFNQRLSGFARQASKYDLTNLFGFQQCNER